MLVERLGQRDPRSTSCPTSSPLGAAAAGTPTVRFPVEGFDLGSLSRLTIELA